MDSDSCDIYVYLTDRFSELVGFIPRAPFHQQVGSFWFPRVEIRGRTSLGLSKTISWEQLDLAAGNRAVQAVPGHDTLGSLVCQGVAVE